MRNDFENGYLAHSSSGWTKQNHKYISRVWKNGKWIYKYKITGTGYKEDAAKAYLSKQKYKGHRARQYQKEYEKAKNNYYNKSLSGITEKTIERGRSTIQKLLNALKPQTTITQTSNLYEAGTKKRLK